MKGLDKVDMIKVGDIGLVATNTEFCFVFDERIYGPYPSTRRVVSLFFLLLDDTHNEKIVDELIREIRVSRFDRLRKLKA